MFSVTLLLSCSVLAGGYARSLPTNSEPLFREITCDFESNNFCAFTPWYPEQGEGEWEVVKASEGHAPAVDHTTNSEDGHYIILNGSDANRLSSVLASPPITAESDALCLSFYYYIAGLTDITKGEIEFNLGLIVGKHVYDDQLTIVWDNTPGLSWQKHQVTIRPTQLSYHLLLKGRRDQHATIAVDDIRIKNGRCTEMWDNDFENGIEHFTQEGSQHWKVSSADTKFSEKMHKAVLSNKSGFAFLDQPGHATLSTPMIAAWKWRQQKCVEFSYVNYGGKLTAKLMLYDNSTSAPVISKEWSMEHTDQWTTVSYGYFVPANMTYKLYFDGSLQRKDNFIGVDDIYINEVPCGHDAMVRTTPRPRPGRVDRELDTIG